MAGVLVVFILWGGLAPNTFMNPMQTSLNATLKMSTGKAGQRPVWTDTDAFIEAKKETTHRLAMAAKVNP